MMHRMILNARVVKWIMFLSNFDLKFINKTYIKDQVIVDQLADALQKNGLPLHIELPDHNLFGVFEIEEPIDHEEYDIHIFFDDSRYERGRGAGVVFVTPQGIPILVSFKLSFEYTNNNVEYKVLILGLKLAIKMKYEWLKIYGNSLLIINQVKDLYACNQPYLKLHKDLVETLLEYFKAYDLVLTPRLMNHFVDMMVSLGSLIPQHPFRRITHMEVITMHKSSLDVLLFNEECSSNT